MLVLFLCMKKGLSMWRSSNKYVKKATGWQLQLQTYSCRRMVSLSADPAKGSDADRQLWQCLESCWWLPNWGVCAGRLASLNRAGRRAQSSREWFKALKWIPTLSYHLDEPTFLPINQTGDQILNLHNGFIIPVRQENRVLLPKELLSPFPFLRIDRIIHSP